MGNRRVRLLPRNVRAVGLLIPHGPCLLNIYEGYFTSWTEGRRLYFHTGTETCHRWFFRESQRHEWQDMVLQRKNMSTLETRGMAKKTPPRSEGTVLTTTVGKRLIRIGQLLKRYSAQVSTIATGISDTVPNHLLNVVTFRAANGALPVASHYWVVTMLPPFSAILRNKHGKPSPYSSNLPLYGSFNLFHHQ